MQCAESFGQADLGIGEASGDDIIAVASELWDVALVEKAVKT